MSPEEDALRKESPQLEGELNLTIRLSDKDTQNHADVTVNIFDVNREVVIRNAIAALITALLKIGILEDTNGKPGSR